MCLGEARKTGLATHERNRAGEERIARQRLINEAGDSVPGSQDSFTPGVAYLQLTDSPMVAFPPLMPSARKSAQQQSKK